MPQGGNRSGKGNDDKKAKKTISHKKKKKIGDIEDMDNSSIHIDHEEGLDPENISDSELVDETDEGNDILDSDYYDDPSHANYKAQRNQIIDNVADIANSVVSIFEHRKLKSNGEIRLKDLKPKTSTLVIKATACVIPNLVKSALDYSDELERYKEAKRIMKKKRKEKRKNKNDDY